MKDKCLFCDKVHKTEEERYTCFLYSFVKEVVEQETGRPVNWEKNDK